MKTIRSRLLSS